MKKGLIITMLLISVLLMGCNTKGEIAKKEEEKLYFNFSHTEIVSNLEEYLIDFSNLGVADGEVKAEKIATYTSITDVFNTDKNNIDAMIHYIFAYDDATNKVSYISFFMDRNEIKAAERYLYHIAALAEYIEPNINTDDIFTAIEKGFNKYDSAIYESKGFALNVSRSEEYFNASFTPIKNAKGE